MVSFRTFYSPSSSLGSSYLNDLKTNRRFYTNQKYLEVSSSPSFLHYPFPLPYPLDRKDPFLLPIRLNVSVFYRTLGVHQDVLTSHPIPNSPRLRPLPRSSYPFVVYKPEIGNSSPFRRFPKFISLLNEFERKNR